MGSVRNAVRFDTEGRVARLSIYPIVKALFATTRAPHKKVESRTRLTRISVKDSSPKSEPYFVKIGINADAASNM